jgi:hypothetical protein
VEVIGIKKIQIVDFPITTDFGNHGIGCPAKKETRGSIRALGRGVPYFVIPFESAKDIYIPSEKWDKILTRYLKSNHQKKP